MNTKGRTIWDVCVTVSCVALRQNNVTQTSNGCIYGSKIIETQFLNCSIVKGWNYKAIKRFIFIANYSEVSNSRQLSQSQIPFFINSGRQTYNDIKTFPVEEIQSYSFLGGTKIFHLSLSSLSFKYPFIPIISTLMTASWFGDGTTSGTHGDHHWCFVWTRVLDAV